MSFMGKQRLSYNDAVKLLGGDSKVMALLGKAAGAGLASVPAVGPVLAFLDLKDDVEQAGQTALSALRTKLTGLSRFNRSQLIEAAHAVLVTSAFFDTLDELDEDLRTGLNSATLGLTGLEQVALAAGGPALTARRLAGIALVTTMSDSILNLSALLLKPHNNKLTDFYAVLAGMLRSFAAGTAVWDSRDETTRDRWTHAITTTLPDQAVTRYEEMLARLAADIPEFAFWAHRVGIRTVLDQLLAVQHDVAALLAASAATTSQLPAAKARQDLAALYRAQAEEPVASTAMAPADVTLPPRRDLYVAPRCRELPSYRWEKTGDWLAERGWDAAGPPTNVWTAVLQHLVSIEATEAPIVLFGQPGAGKSMFTQMLAASLDPRDFLVVRVELRTVPADASVAEQITSAVKDLTLRSIDWPDLAETASGAQPVIILDGFDELLQASGRDRQDYLEQVRQFQRDEQSRGRPAVVLVTSRTAIANQVRYPEGTIALRLEDFDDDEVNRWLGAWNAANPHRPLALEVALAQDELTRQPLLLFMLALFHAGGGSLTEGMRRAELYQALFREFAVRDVRKLDGALPDTEQNAKAERDLDLLSLVAFAMFNRGREWVTEEELIVDLAVLGNPRAGLDLPSGRALVARLAGRFFFRLFVQRDQAVGGGQQSTSRFEFLHATFGEFLIARWVTARLRDPATDTLCHALLSHAVLTTREQRILGFLTELLAEFSPAELSVLRTRLEATFRDSMQPRADTSYAAYRPADQAVPTAYAAYSANVFVLLLLTAEAEAETTNDPQRAVVSGASFPGGGQAFYQVTRLWHAQLAGNGWSSLLDVINIHWPESAKHAAEPEFTRRPPSELLELTTGAEFAPFWRRRIIGGEPWLPLNSFLGDALREAQLLSLASYQDALIRMIPYYRAADRGIFDVGSFDDDMVMLLTSPPWELRADRRADLYRRLLQYTDQVRPSRLLLEQLRIDISRLRTEDLAELAAEAAPVTWTHVTAYLDIVAALHAVRQPVTDLLTRLYEGGYSTGLEHDPAELADILGCEIPDWRIGLTPLLIIMDMVGSGPLRLPTRDLSSAQTREALRYTLLAAAAERGLPVDGLLPLPELDADIRAWLNELVPGWLDEHGEAETGL
jgi:hypothetical protein